MVNWTFLIAENKKLKLDAKNHYHIQERKKQKQKQKRMRERKEYESHVLSMKIPITRLFDK